MTVHDRAIGRTAGEAFSGLTTPILPSADELLQASRRVDWRFLLPNPTLGQVAYIGPVRGKLLESLQQFSSSVNVLERLDTAGASYDVVVARDPSRVALRSALSLVKPGGYIYAEFAGVWHHPGRDAATIRRSGFVGLQLHWHWPNFEECTRIIPLDSPAVLAHALVKGRSGIVPQSEAALVRWLHRSGVLGFAVRDFSLVAQRGEV
jgi:hypothetical protein